MNKNIEKQMLAPFTNMKAQDITNSDLYKRISKTVDLDSVMMKYMKPLPKIDLESQLKSYLGGGGLSGMLGSVLSSLGGLTDSLNNAMSSVSDIAGNVTDSLGDLASGISDTVSGSIGNLSTMAGDLGSQVTSNLGSFAQDSINNVTEGIGDYIKDGMESQVKNTITNTMMQNAGDTTAVVNNLAEGNAITDMNTLTEDLSPYLKDGVDPSQVQSKISNGLNKVSSGALSKITSMFVPQGATYMVWK